jgi:hypothetical protein
MFYGFQRAMSHTYENLLGMVWTIQYNKALLLVTIEKFETKLVLVNVNKLKPYKYMESKVQKQEQQMPIYWE